MAARRRPARAAAAAALLAALAHAAPARAQAGAGDAPPAAGPRPDPCDSACAGGLSFRLHARARFEALDRQALVPGSRAGAAVLYHRVLGAVGARAGPVRAYAQLGVHRRSGGIGPAAPIAVDRPDVQQAFLDVRFGRPGAGVRLRGGRAEMPFELVATRDAPNVRRAWDGVRATGAARGWTAEAFAARVVQPRVGTFDDASHRADRLAGGHLTGAVRGPTARSVRAFYYDVRQPRLTVLAGAAAARTRTYGGVVGGRLGGGEWSAGGARQTGRFGARRVGAFYAEAEAGRRFAAARARPRVALRSSLFSGGPPNAARLRTFNPLFPNFAYSTEAALQSPSNLVKGAVLATAAPARRLTLAYRGEGLWRYSARDAFYVPTGFAPVAPDGHGRRWLGVQQQLRAEWALARALTLSGAYVQFDAGAFLRRAGRGGQRFVMTQLSLDL